MPPTERFRTKILSNCGKVYTKTDNIVNISFDITSLNTRTIAISNINIGSMQITVTLSCHYFVNTYRFCYIKQPSIVMISNDFSCN